VTYTMQTEDGTITVPAGVLAQIVRRAAHGVDGARVRRPRRGLEVELDGTRTAVSLELAVRHGAVLPELAHEVQARVAHALTVMCGLDVTRVDVSIEELEDR
jgi:uncharacterized alkaline shock family protein YloU